MTEDPRNPQDDETPDAAGDVAEPEASADPSESPAAETPAEEPAAETPAEEPVAETPAEEPVAETPAEEPAAEAPADETPAEEPAAEAEQPAADAAADPTVGGPERGAPAPEGTGDPGPAEAPDVTGPEGAAEAGGGAEAGADLAGLDEGSDAELAKRRDRPKPSAKKQSRREESGEAADVVPGAHLEPDLVLETAQETPDEFGAYAQTYEQGTNPEDGSVDTRPAEPPSATEDGTAEAPVVRTPLDLAADARYSATGKRKTAVARVILKPGDGTYTVNGRTLDVFFPRPGLQRQARGPLETAGYESRMDVIAKIHGGGVSSQAGALRHGIAKALVEADPNLRTELKRHGFLTRDARVKERKKAGLKKARKRPQFSKR
jgi:small subunit ribosomal protein S9